MTAAEHPLMFKKIQRESTLSGMVSAQIQQLIVEKQLHPGDRLPAERDLAEQFGVSRTVVREAVRGLAAKGLLNVSPGRGGTKVKRPSADSVTQSMTLYLQAGQPFDYEKLIEVRRALEVEIAGLAAQRRTDADLALLHENLTLGERDDHDRESFVQTDVDFHALLAQATHNELWSLLLESLGEALREGRWRGYDVPGTAARACQYHRAILAKVEKGDVEGAREAMLAHLIEAADTSRKAMALWVNPA